LKTNRKYRLVDTTSYDDPFVINYGLERAARVDTATYNMTEIYNMVWRIMSQPHHIKYSLQLEDGTHVSDITDLIDHIKTVDELNVL